MKPKKAKLPPLVTMVAFIEHADPQWLPQTLISLASEPYRGVEGKRALQRHIEQKYRARKVRP